MNNTAKIIVTIVIVLLVSFIMSVYINNQKKPIINSLPVPQNPNPLSIESLRERNYPGSAITIEQTLADGSNYHQYIASYKSDGLKIYALLTVPLGSKPQNGFPVIVFNHGFIPPATYKTTERYVAYVDSFARSGYIVFKPDYRGNGNSEGSPEGAYYSPAYVIDDLNAISSIKKYKDADPSEIGVWGHSMGGNITLRDLIVNTKDIKAAVIWGGVVGSYNDLMNNWQRRVVYQPPSSQMFLRNSGRGALTKKYGTPQENPSFWNSIDPTYYLSDITAPVQLHTGGADEEVPVEFSLNLYQKLKNLGKTVEYYNYPGGDHNISSPNFEVAMQRSIEFFNKYLLALP